MPDSRHVTLTGNTVATVTLDNDYGQVEVINVDGAAAVYFTIDGATPSVAGTGTLVLPAVVSSYVGPAYGSQTTTVRLISTGTPKVSVRGW